MMFQPLSDLVDTIDRAAAAAAAAAARDSRYLLDPGGSTVHAAADVDEQLIILARRPSNDRATR